MGSLINRYDPVDDFFRGFFVRPVGYEAGATETSAPIKVDVRAHNDSYVVLAEIPGVSKEAIQVSIDGTVVSISAEKKQEQEARDGERVLRTERYYGKVSRSIDLGVEIDEAQSAARYENGVLALTLPKKAAAPTRRLQIQ